MAGEIGKRFSVLRDRSGLAILVSNGVAIFFAMIEGWNLRPLIALYWCQSVIIGIFHFFRMVRLRDFSTEGLTSNGEPVPETTKGKWSTAIFFAFHYGFFHFVYFVFVAGMAFGATGGPNFGPAWHPDGWDVTWLVIAVLSFLAGHAYSYRENVEADLAGRPNLGMMLFLPYVRVVPMHLTIIFGFWMGSSRGALLLFMLLKTAADLAMHSVEHRIMQKSGAKGP